MNPNELLVRETRAWLAKALDDLESARVLANARLEGTALYHCQQAAEKSLKSVSDLAQLAVSKDAQFERTGGTLLSD